MAAHSELLLLDIMTALRVAHAHHDLSSEGSPLTHKVVIADGGIPVVRPPYVLVTAPSWEPDYDASIGLYRVSGLLEWWGFAPATLDTPEDRGRQALRLADDIVRALQAAHRTPALATLYGLEVFLPRVLQVFADGVTEAPSCGMCYGTITYRVLDVLGG